MGNNTLGEQQPMRYAPRPNEQRRESRLGLELPAQISVGSQLALQGRLKDLSFKSAFIAMRNSVYLQMNDEVGFVIQPASGNDTDLIQGLARISRIAVGEGLAIYFTRMDQDSANRLRELLSSRQ